MFTCVGCTHFSCNILLRGHANYERTHSCPVLCPWLKWKANINNGLCLGVQQLISPCYCSKCIINAEQTLQSAEDMDGSLHRGTFFWMEEWNYSALNCKFRFTFEINCLTDFFFFFLLTGESFVICLILFLLNNIW